jgi:hypothetical protein
VIVILVQTEDAAAGDQVVNCADETGRCTIVVIENGTVTRGAPTTANGGSA